MIQDNSFSEEENFTKSLGKRAQTCHHDFPSLLMPSLLNLDLMSHRNHPKIISEIITWRELQLQEKLCPTWNLILWSQRTVWEVQGYSTYICISHLCQTMVMSPQNMKHYRSVICFSKSSWFPSSELLTFLPIFLIQELLTWITPNLACISGNVSSSQCNFPYVYILPCNLSLCLSYLSSMTFYFLVFQLPLCAVPFTSDIYVNIQVS